MIDKSQGEPVMTTKSEPQPTLALPTTQAPDVPAGRLTIQTNQSPGRRTLRRFLRHRLAMFGLVALVLMTLLLVAAPWVAPYDFAAQDLARFREAPSADHLLGTDSFGRDVLSRLIYGGRVSLSVGLIAVVLYETIAVVLGALAGYYGGKIDTVIMRLVDIVMTFPTLIIIIFLVTILGPSMYNAMLAIGLLGWTGPTRLVRAQILSLREMDYITAAHGVGVPARRVILRHILPGVVAPLVVHATLTEAGLSFLGLGVQPPTASWGNMMSDAKELVILEQMPWLWVAPGFCIMLSVLCINFLGDGLRDALDPRGKISS
jgi:peptide/nickel transport system permease protein